MLKKKKNGSENHHRFSVYQMICNIKITPSERESFRVIQNQQKPSDMIPFGG